MNKEAFIIDSIRTAKASAIDEGSLSSVKPIDLLLPLLKNLLNTHHLQARSMDALILGCIAQSAEQGNQLAYALSNKASFGPKCSTVMINSGRASALEAINYSLGRIQTGQSELVMATSVLSHSRQRERILENMLFDDPSLFYDNDIIKPALSADCLATLRGFTRRDLDQYALFSHQKAGNAYDKGLHKNSLLTIRDSLNSPLLSYDELVRENITMEELASFSTASQETDKQGGEKLRAYQYYGLQEDIRNIHHPGNSAPPADAAGALLLASLAAAKKYGIVPRAKIRSLALGHNDSVTPFSAQKHAIELALERAKLSIEDIDLFEVDESYSAWPLHFIDQFNVKMDLVNVNGGSIATGEAQGVEPLFMLSSLLDELERRKRRLGLITFYNHHHQAHCCVVESLGDRL